MSLQNEAEEGATAALACDPQANLVLERLVRPKREDEAAGFFAKPSDGRVHAAGSLEVRDAFLARECIEVADEEHGDVRGHGGSVQLQVRLKSRPMRIGELARQVGLRTSAIRYYEELGVLAPPARVSGRREYGLEAVGALRLVLAAQQAGFTLGEVRTLLSILTSQQGASGRWPELARAKLEELDEGIERLRAARAVLVDAIDCACAGEADACKLVAARSRRTVVRRAKGARAAGPAAAPPARMHRRA